jgi:O-antigen/teichoic acid export membrane protein
MKPGGGAATSFVAVDETGGSRARSAPLHHLMRRLGWGIADQGVSSLANFVLGVVVARSMSADDFGAFTLAFVTFSFVISGARGPSTDPLLVRFSGRPTHVWRKAVAAATGTSLAAGTAAGLACVVIGLLLPWALGAPFVALGVGLPGIMLQDSYRFGFFSCGQAHRAFVNDLVWGVLQVSGVAFLAMGNLVTPGSAMLVFGGTGALAALFGFAQMRVAPTPLQARAWLVEHRALGTRYLFENLSFGSAKQIRVAAVGLVAGLAAVGNIRAAEMLMGPFMILLAGVSQVAVPEAKRVLAKGAQGLYRFSAIFAGVQALLVAVWGVITLIVLPRGAGQALLGDLWDTTAPRLLPTLVVLWLVCFQTSAAAAIRALGASRRGLAAQLFSAVVSIVLGVGGAMVDGSRGSCWGLALATLIGLGAWAWELRAAVNEHVPPTLLNEGHGTTNGVTPVGGEVDA